jgi:hypothetical protein
MKTRQLGLVVAGLLGLVIAFEVGLHLQNSPAPPRNPKSRRITISASSPPGSGQCEVDYPVADLHYDHTVEWASDDNKYWVSFITIEPPETAENPLIPADDPVIVDPRSIPKTYNVKSKTKYYMYAIFDHDPAAGNKTPCKRATDDHDTGLNVKPR